MGKINKLTLSSIIIMIGMMLNKLLGFIREVSIANAFGASIEADIYFFAYMIPSIIFSLFSRVMTTTFIPVFLELKNNKGEDYAMDIANSLVNVIIFLSTIITVLGISLAKFYIPYIAMGFEGENLLKTIRLTQIMFPLVVFLAVTTIISGILQAYSRFFVQTIVWLPNNIVIIAYNFILSRYFGIKGLAIATVIAGITQILIQIPELIKVGYKYKFIFDIKNPYIIKMVNLMIPIFIGAGVAQINVLVDKALASTLAEGSISSLNFANRLISLPISIFVISIGTAAYPRLSEMAGSKNYEEFVVLIKNISKTILLIIAPITIAAMILRYPIIEFLFQRGAFNKNATKLTAIALFYYSIGLIGVALRDILNRAFYAMQDTRTPVINSIISIAINIVLNLILIKFMGHGGLALATSIANILTIVLLVFSLNKKINFNIGWSTFKYLFNLFIVTLSTAVIMNNSLILLKGFNAFVLLVIETLIMAISYLILLKLFRFKEVDLFLKKIPAIGRKFIR